MESSANWPTDVGKACSSSGRSKTRLSEKSNAAAAAHAAKFAIPLEWDMLEFVYKPLADLLSGEPEELLYHALPA
jgi:hypothetical protein